MIETRGRSENPVGTKMRSLASAIGALPDRDGNLSQVITAVLTDRGVEKVTRHLREQDVLDDDVSIRDLTVKQYSYLSGHAGVDKAQVVTMAISLSTSESQDGDNASLFVYALPSIVSVAGNFPAQESGYDVDRERYVELANKFHTFAEPLFDTVTSAIQAGHATRGSNQP